MAARRRAAAAVFPVPARDGQADSIAAGQSEDPWFTIPQAARYAQVSEPTIRRAIRRRELVAYRPARLWRVRRSAVDAWVTRAIAPSSGEALSAVTHHAAKR